MSTKSDLQLAEAKLLTSGLSLRDAKDLNIKVLSPKETASKFAGLSVPSLLLTYHDQFGKPRKDIFRLRLLQDPPPGAYGEAPEKPRRYLQPAGSPPAAYLPPTIDWPDVFIDTGRTILITEGELKAACAAKHELACLGLGGVSSWQSSSRGWRLLPELQEIEWLKRDVVIAFDSDVMTKPQVAAAVAGLTNELMRLGALPRVLVLPTLPKYDKTGLDDFIVDQGLKALLELLDEAPSDELSKKLWEFNSRFSYVFSPGVIYDEKLHQVHQPTQFYTTHYANVTAVRQDGKVAKVAESWVKWPQRRQVSQFTYVPGGARFIKDELNTWPGWGCAPKRGNMKPWKALLDRLFGDEHESRQWFERWCLYPIRHPGAKLNSAVVIWSNNQGVGKSALGDTVSCIYGKNYIAISQRELESDFNDWAVSKQFVMVDDVSSHDSRSKADILKKVITQKNLIINQKYVGRYQLPDCLNYYLTSNRPNALYVEDQDRRYFVHEVTAGQDNKFFDSYYDWLKSGGAEALFYYALHDIDFKGFHVHSPPPVSLAKSDMISSARSDFDAFLHDLKEYPDSMLVVGKHKLVRDLYTPSEVLRLFEPRCVDGRLPSTVTVGMKMRGVFQKVARGMPIRVDGKRGERFYALRNADHWKDASSLDCLNHVRDSLEAETASSAQRKF